MTSQLAAVWTNWSRLDDQLALYYTTLSEASPLMLLAIVFPSLGWACFAN